MLVAAPWHIRHRSLYEAITALLWVVIAMPVAGSVPPLGVVVVVVVVVVVLVVVCVVWVV